MSPVKLKKRSCHPVEFKGQGSQQWLVHRNSRPANILSTFPRTGVFENTVHLPSTKVQFIDTRRKAI